MSIDQLNDKIPPHLKEVIDRLEIQSNNAADFKQSLVNALLLVSRIARYQLTVSAAFIALKETYMKRLTLTGSLGLLSALLVATPGLTQDAQVEPSALLREPPSTTFNVVATKGNCPSSVGLWTGSRPYEGGAENTAIADTSSIAGRARSVRSAKKFVVYRARLNKEYASCVGHASSPEYPSYKFTFRRQRVYFRVDLPPGTLNSPTKFTSRSVLLSRPMVKWAIAD
ncbi:MAG: hypothetical protein KME17_14645 [Cyanosarcina radialis HA8281-LM2]|nr:hypothetical protein [Cyanosarcina radialis HA8281-LM2]